MTNLLTNARYVSGSLVLAMLVSGCASQAPQRDSGSAASQPSASPVASAAPSGERYAMSGDAYPVAPPDVSQVPDAEPRIEEPSRAGNRPTYEVWGETYRVLPDSRGYARQGTASWYGEKFHGYATSNGEIYDMYKMTAAHRSLPLPTFARVTSLANGRSVIVRVNDRGPFHSDREIDLSYAAAARLGILDDGTGPVRVEAIDPAQWLAERGRGGEAARSTAVSAPVPAASAPSVVSAPAAPASSPSPAPAQASGDGIFLQIAALGTAEGAQQLQQRLSGELAHGVRVKSEAEVHRVQVGPVSPAQENQAREDLRRAGFPQVFIVR
ncbi:MULTISPECIES: septal ring lytic transglycosylase RlpA family protein [unclassified Halomonas]|uniref:septal ring lytic transglycosylase RlpA family protein n=1 Tax=unclassified Halomonas TaxID=2609666 RepID=UPI0011A74A86|nr:MULTISPECIES: septal ring lytic transglycosylase RlpA family protein [unclassified Halomonas]UDM05788.1 septal ring lytic transglycosylase RlpA family protein [Halomonas sp. NyZ770]